MRSIRLLALTVLLGSVGCNNSSPYGRTKNDQGGALGSFGAAGQMKIFSDELFSGGGAFLYPGGENQTLVFNDRSNPVSQRSIRYFWSGQPPKAGDPGFIFAGVDLMYTPTQAQYGVTTPRNLSAAGYTKVTFYARGGLSSLNVLKIEVADDGNQSTPAPCMVLSMNGTDDVTPPSSCLKGRLTSNWQKLTIPIANSNLVGLMDFFKATFVFNSPLGNLAPGQGGTVYLDQIFYEP